MLIHSPRAARAHHSLPGRRLKSVVIAVLALSAGSAALVANAAGDAANGQKVVMQCQLCHTLVAGKNSIGPSLAGVVGRKAGTAPGFKYSDAVVKAGEGGLVWDEKTLDRWIENPASVVPGNKMTFAGLKKQQDRDDAIAFLKTKTQ